MPAYWRVRQDILAARARLNFSTLGSSPAAAQKAALYESLNMIRLGAMPLPLFLKLHPDARVTPEETKTIETYLAPWTTPLATAPAANADIARTSLAAVPPEFNGFPFDPTFETWRLISTTDRGDNNTFRFILGNAIAVKAAQSGNVMPWPDGTRFAKIAWQQELGGDGLVHPGKFVQVELMLKDAARHRDTEGWSWGRWRGLDLKPYGKDAHFVDECTGCHQPMRDRDYVYTLPMTGPGAVATLPATLPDQPLSWSPITMYVDPKTHATATLFGNEAARRNSPGATVALVTWAQRDDPHWFGARIPSTPQSVEVVEQGTGYRRFAGAGLSEDHPEAAVAAGRRKFILGLAPAQLP